VNYEEAVRNLKLAVEYDTDKIYNHYSFDMFYSDAEAFAALAEAQSQLAQTAEAKENILKAIELEPENTKLQEIKMKLGF
jgi:tetratricopeptide (TPR) repeat protein